MTREPVESIRGEHRFLTTSGGEFLVREELCPCGRLLSRSEILIGRGTYARSGTVCKRCKARVVITLSTGP